MRKLLLLLVVFGALPLFGQGTSFPVFNRQGWTMAGAVVGTCNGPADPGTNTLYCTSPVTTYVDWTLSTPCTNVTTIPNPPGPPLGPTDGAGCTNPGLTDSHGNATIFAANGFYWALVSGYQVVPQTFPFNIGSGGSGVGLIPCGVVNDVQLYGTPTNLGCDSGILIGNPSTHTLSDNIINANRQLQVGDTTNTGKEVIGFSNGSSVLANFTFSLSPTFSTIGGGYGIDFPDSPPSSANCLTTTGSLGVDGRYPTSWGACGGGGGAISIEYEYPLDFTNAPSPTTTTDIVRTLFPQGTSRFLGGPLPISQPLFFVAQDVIAGEPFVGNLVVNLPNPVIPGDILWVVADSVVGAGCSTAFTFSDSLGNTWHDLDFTTIPSTSSKDAYATVVNGGVDTVTLTTSNPGACDNLSTNLHVVEVTGVSAVDDHSVTNPVIWSTAGTPTNLSSVTTTFSTDVILSSVQSAHTAPNVLTAGSGYAIVNQIATNDFDSLGTEGTYVNTTGTYTPPIIGSVQPAGGGAGPSYTIAFKYTGTTGSAPPFFRLIRYIDLQQSGDFPTTVGQNGKCMAATAVPGVLNWITCGSGGGDTITSPNSTLGVGGTSTNTTLDVLGAAGKMLAGATPALTYTPALGVDGSQAGTLTLSNSSSPFHTTIGTQASANWTFKLPATAGTNTNLLETDGSGNTSWVAAPVAGDSITSPNSTISVGGTSTATTVDVAGAAGKILAGATPALTFTPQLGVDNTNAGTLALSNGSAIAHTILGSAATATNTILGPAVVIPNGHLVECSTSGTVCTFTDGGVPAGAPAFSVITSGTNTAATMVVGSGASLAPTSASAGVISANQINGTALGGLATGLLKNTTTTGVPSVVSSNRAISFQLGIPGGSSLSTGVLAYVTVPFACTITGWSIEADAGTATIKFLKVASGTAIPTLGSNSISTSGVALASGTVIQSTTLTDFTTTTVTANDIVAADMITTSGVGFINAQLVCAQ